MSSTEGSAVTLVVETDASLPSFLEDKIDLKKLAREVSKASSKAVEVILKLLESSDEKVRLTAASKLVEFQVQIAKEISHDQLTRLIAELRRGEPKTKKLIQADTGDSTPKTPLVDFGTIRQIN